MALLLGIVALLPGCSGATPSPEALVPPTAPPILDDATGPRGVLEVFLKTLVIHDCAAAMELSTPAGFAEVGGFCERINVVDFVIRGDAMSDHPDAVTFATRLTIDGANDVMAPGDHAVFFSLAREPDGPWRVSGGGTRPGSE